VGVFDHLKAELFAAYAVQLKFEDKLMGGVPKNPKVIQGWLRAKAGITEARELFQVTARTMEENGTPLGVSPSALAEMDADEMYNIIDRATEEHAALKSTNGFKSDDDGLYIEDRQVKAMLKESTNIVFPYQKGKKDGQWGTTKKTPKSFLAETVFVRPGRLYLGTEEPDGIELMPGHVKDQLGKRSTLTYHEYVERPVLNFEVEVMRDELTLDQWGLVWLHAQSNGLGALRSQSHGRFEVTKFERVA
jgi:hypothetical protein